jgi:DNA-binding NtrC family response regulator
MFDIRRLWRSPEHAPTKGPSQQIQLLAITRTHETRARLREIAAAYDWSISIVESAAEAVATLARAAAPLVICDRDLPEEDWHDVLDRIAALPHPACVLLASQVTDQYLWDEVIQHHGYDVVLKPFQADELRRVVTFAWRAATSDSQTAGRR